MQKMYDSVKRFLVQVTEMGLLLIALAVVAGVIVGPGNVPFVGEVVSNLTALIKSLGDSGIVGLIAVGIIIWLLSKR
ncbi:MAG: hypothetical protein CFH08_01682 [Alphaproteobacteria bacterium MarineAlpha3_Bin7]|jgi:ABC-type enterochelin transport system permease subunit|nr:MAG: hypothetical protein CFH08_01682 [Alphaproteobacteria bacterium MarineAlpha3_Bin7]|tara:strand:+ start:1080 stop:1310 length:231 start_codon:yes stop_codon:yes gene_type:complete